MRTRLRVTTILLGLSALLIASSVAGSGPDVSFGDPLPGLSAAEQAAFESGKAQFETVEDVADGLGPVFNEASCVACHNGPAVGGGNGRLVTRFGSILSDGSFDPMPYLGGSLIQDHAIPGFTPEVVPASASIVAHRRTTSLFGLGLVDAVPDATFLAIAQTQALESPEVAGRVNFVTNRLTNQTAVGRFGWKAQIATLFEVSADEYVNELGITNPLFPNENCPQGDCSLLVNNPRPDLNDDGTAVQAVTAFMTLLAPPPRGPVTPDAAAGRGLFTAIGCGICHVPTSFRTGPHQVGALSNKTFFPFSDFLLHNMGSLGDGIAQGQATGGEMRTAPLWGLREQVQLLHDGRAQTIEDAILAHDGQGKTARDGFAALPFDLKAKLLAFLNSL